VSGHGARVNVRRAIGLALYAAAAALALLACAQTNRAAPSPAGGSRLATPPALPPILWTDDFLGVTVDPRYAQSVTGTGAIKIAEGGMQGGAVVLGATGSGAGVARLRLGEEASTGKGDVRGFSVERHVVLQARVMLNTTEHVAVTIGFVGPNDDQHALAAIYNTDASPTWQLQAHNGALSSQTQVDTQFRHTAGAWTVIELATETSDGAPTATLLIDGQARGVVTGPAVPLTGLVPELQVWNRPAGDGWQQTSLYVDYLQVRQDR